MKAHDALALRTGRFGTCVTRATSLRARTHGALNLGQGYPQEQPPDAVVEAAHRAIRDGSNHYADMRGEPRLRRAVAEWTSSRTGINFNAAEHITVTCGATEAMLVTLLSLVEPSRNDEVLVTLPWYENYWPQVALADGKLTTVALSGSDLRLTEEALAAAWSDRTRVFVICNPHNPSGRVLDEVEWALIAKYCIRFNTICVVDEVYAPYVYDEDKPASVSSFPDMHERTVFVNSISKLFAATGWRVGWVVAPAWLTPAVRRVHDFVSAVVPTPFQIAATTALGLPESYYVDLKGRYARKRRLVCDALQDGPWRFRRPEGTYYLFADVSGSGLSSGDLVTDLMSRAGVALVPGEAFYPPGRDADRFVRLSFARDDDLLRDACSRIRAYFDEDPRAD